MWYFIKKLFHYRWQLLLGLLLSVLLAAASIALLSLSGWFISAAGFAGLSVVTATAFNYFIPAGTIRLLAFIRILSRYGERVINHDFTFRILTELRIWFYKSLIPLAPTYLMEQRSGNLLNKMINDIDALDHLYLRFLSPCLIGILATILVTIFISFYAPLIAWIILIACSITYTLLPFITHFYGRKIGADILITTTNLRTKSLDVLQGIIPLLFYKPKSERLNEVAHAISNFSNSQKKAAKLKAAITSSMTLISGLALWLALYVGITLVNKNQINGAQLAMILLCILVTFEQLLPLPLAFLAMGKTQFAAKRILAVTKQSPTIIYPKKTVPKQIFTPDIKLNHVQFQYANRTCPTLKDINLHIPAGSKFGIHGRSGSGKTTLMHLIARVLDPTSGTIFLNDSPIQQYSEADLRRHIALVPQRIHIFNASVKDNLTLMDKSVPLEKLYEALELLEMKKIIDGLPNGIHSQMGDFGSQFSGGQIRRIGLARALLTNASLHIWDEPSTGLNQQLLDNIWSQCMPVLKNKTLLVITHNSDLISKMDHNIYIENGLCSDINDTI